MSEHGSKHKEQVLEHLELLLNKEGQILTEEAEDYLRSTIKNLLDDNK